MAIDLETERIIPLREAPTHCPGRPHVSAFYRWMSKRENPLETILVGGRRHTSVEAIYRFIERCTNPDTTNLPVTSRQRARDFEATEKALDKMGV